MKEQGNRRMQNTVSMAYSLEIECGREDVSVELEIKDFHKWN